MAIKITEGITPLPWPQNATGGSVCTEIEGVLLNIAVCLVDLKQPDTHVANPAYIAHACNMFPELVEALEKLSEDYADAAGEWSSDVQERAAPILDKARTALARAKGEAPREAPPSNQQQESSMKSTDEDTELVITLGEQPFGTSHWAGMWNGHPAISLSFYNGATLFYFDGEWKKEKFENLAKLHAMLGINK